MSEKWSIEKHITDEIIRMLEEGKLPAWSRPFEGYGRSDALTMPRNYNSGRAYRGVNVFWLAMRAQMLGWDCNLWATAKGIKKAGGTIRETEFHKNGGAGSTPVILWKKMPDRPARKDETPDYTDENGRPMRRGGMLLRSYNVWNLAQCEGIELPEGTTPDEDDTTFDPIASAEEVVALWDGFEHETGGNVACYIPLTDTIRMPDRKKYERETDFYAALFHEGVHKTGHADRLNRDGITKLGSSREVTQYADEELVAEMGAAMLCGHAGISTQTIENSAAYLQGWLKRFKEDREEKSRLIINAAARAQRAVDMILGTKFEEQTTDEKETATA